MRPLVQLSGVAISSPSGRPLFDGLKLSLARERVALVGRNGVGKSTLLSVLAGTAEPRAGSIRTSSPPHFVAQVPSCSSPVLRAASSGERRRAALAEAMLSGAEILLLDEPTEDLDEASVAWLRSCLTRWEGCLVVASHDRRLLQDFDHFFIASETGCRYRSGSLAEVEAELDQAYRDGEIRYARSLGRLVAEEAHTERVTRRRDRKKRRGRCSELDRATPRIRLNGKRGAAQVYQGKFAKARQARLDSVRRWTRATRRALEVELSLVLPVPSLLEPCSNDVVTVRGASVHANGGWLFEAIDVSPGRRKIAVVGANGSGKTTLLDVLMGRRSPTAGTVHRDPTRIGCIEQGGTDWMRDESLLAVLAAEGAAPPEALAALLVAHKFPLALARRPLRSLSPGERTRAALISLFQRSPPLELLVLDEPTFSLDLVAQRALTRALRAWPGGLVVASHDHAFLSEIGVDEWIRLGQ